MGERDVGARLIGRRYLCDECGDEMQGAGAVMLASSPPLYPHECPQGHRANLLRRYPGYDVHIDAIQTKGGGEREAR